MNTHSSGCYVIDSEYNIVNANSTALKVYPQLTVGKKCYTCLMGLNEPCGPCPVANGVKGPSTYMDPIRHISEIVDAVDIDIDGHGPCHMLIFATVENEASFAATLPTNSEELKNLALIKGLTSDYADVFSVNVADGNMCLYRLKGKPVSIDSAFGGFLSYTDEMEKYIRKYVYLDDQEMMRSSCSLSSLKETLKTTENIYLHYRIFLNGEMHYYMRKIVRIGEPDSFENIVVGIVCEDDEVKQREKQIRLQNTLRKVELNTTTGLLTKEAFFIHGDRLLRKKADLSFDFCFLKIENLDSIGRQYGPKVKNQVIQNVGDILRGYVNDTTCTGYFGDGMYVCFVESQNKEVFQALITSFEKQVHESGNIKNILFKWSVYKHVSREQSTEETYNKISYILNIMRSSTHDNYTEIDQNLLQQINWDISVEQNFQNALQNGEFKVWFQPKYSVHTREILGAEALVRWVLPGGEIIPPFKFVPILENSGLINQLDEEVFRQVCIFQRKRMEQNLPLIPISVNLSRASLFTHNIPELYEGIAKAHGVSTGMIPIEITESAAVRASMIDEFAKDLLSRGFPLHMDDFGAGYSSLASLQTLPFECIKIDKSLVDFIGMQNSDSILKHTIAFAKEIGLYVIAEGVEKIEQFLFLKIAGCDAIQGYYFSKPMNEETFSAMLDKKQT